MRQGYLTDQRYLRDEQYRDSGKLRDRMGLHERFSTNPRGWQRWVFDRLDLAPGCQVLEVGCGPGRLWLENAAHLPADLRLVLADYSPGMAREAGQGLRRASPTLRVVGVNADAQALPFADARFDLVVANHMLYHVPDRARAIAELRRVLRPGGRLYAATNGARHLEELDRLLGGGRIGGALAFNLEGGGEELARSFAEVALEGYDDALVVTEAAPLLAYIRSFAPGDGRDFSRLAAAIERRLVADGAIRITKETGLFVAR